MSTQNSGGVDIASIVINGIVILLALIACGLRFYSRIVTKAGVGRDDWLILTATVTSLFPAFLILAGMSYGSSSNSTSTGSAEVLYLKLVYSASILYFTVASATKLGILFMYNRLFSVDRTFCHQLYAMVFLVIAYWIASTLATMLNCIPLHYNWTQATTNPQHCFNFNVFWMAAGSCEVLLDVLTLILPVRAILKLQMSMRKKASIVVVFLLGGFTVVTGILRVYFGYSPGQWTPSIYSRTEFWTLLHAYMAIILACLPVLQPLIKRRSKVESPSLNTQSSFHITERSRLSRSWPFPKNRDRSPDGAESVDEMLEQEEATSSIYETKQNEYEAHTSQDMEKGMLTGMIRVSSPQIHTQQEKRFSGIHAI